MLKSYSFLSGLAVVTCLSMGLCKADSNLPETGTQAVTAEKTDRPAQAATAQNSADPATVVLSRADEHFNKGRQFYFQSNLTAARREFDAAVNTLLSAPDSLPGRRRIERKL